MARLSTHDETADPANATHGNRLRVAILFCVIPRYKKVLKMVTSLSNACVLWRKLLQFPTKIQHTCNRPSRLLGIVIHFDSCPGILSAFSKSSIAPCFFFNFLTSASTAFSAHFSSSSPCFQPRSFLVAGLVNEINELNEFIFNLILTRCYYGTMVHKQYLFSLYFTDAENKMFMITIKEMAHIVVE